MTDLEIDYMSAYDGGEKVFGMTKQELFRRICMEVEKLKKKVNELEKKAVE